MVPSKRFERLLATERSSKLKRLGLSILTCLIVTLIFLTDLNVMAANDWPQINGPNRNGIAENETLFSQWPAEGLKQVWSHPIGQGNAGPVVVGDKLIVFHRPAKEYLVEALNPRTGKLIWNKRLPAEYTGGVDGDLGPKSVPLIHSGHVYLLGAGGILYCLDLDDGTVVWRKNLLREYRSRPGYFGVGSTPIVVQNKLILNVGGKNSAIVALDLNTGAEAWKSFDDDASYSSPISLDIAGESVVVFITRLNLVGLSSATGKVLFQTRFGKPGPTVNGAMPVSVNRNGKQFLFASAAYGVGARWLEVSKNKLEKKWGNDTSFSTQYSTPVYVDGSLFGTAGREDHQNGSYRCIDASSGKLLWKRDGIPVGHSLLVGKQILVLDSVGGFHVLEANKSKFTRIYHTKLFKSKSRSMPAIANGLFYARSNANNSGQGKLVCVEIGTSRK